MKLRTGFVSNSSSSSFVCIGRPISLDELVTARRPFAVDEYNGWDGMLAYNIDDEMMDFIYNNKDLFEDVQFIDFLGEGEGSLDIDLENLIGKIRAFGGFVDHHSPTNLQELKETYMKD